MAKAKYTRGADGYFQTKVWDGSYTDKGTKHRVTLRTKQSSRALEDMVKEVEEKVRNREYITPSSLSVKDYAKQWLKLYKQGASRNTNLMYENIINKHFNSLEAVKISEIRKTNIIMCLNEAAGKERIQEQILLTLKQVVKSAIADKYLPVGTYEELFAGIKVKCTKKTEKRPLTAEEKKAVFESEFTDMQKAFLYIIYGCGLRRGEALALTRFDFDFKGQKVNINKSLGFDGNEPYIKTTKSRNGMREVPIPSKVLPFLKSYCIDLPGANLFYTRGKDMITFSSYRKMWEGIQKAMDAPDLTAHIFRHNYCTNLCYQIPAISIKKIAELLGDREKMVIEVYNHVLAEKEDTQKAVEQALNF